LKTLKLKITGYDEQTNSLLVSFASDSTKSQNPEDYPSYAYQPMIMWPDVTDPQEVIRRIAASGLYHAEQQALTESFIEDEDRINSLKSLVSQSAQYAIDDLMPSQISSIEINNIQVV
jgi:hypothetical protein